MLPKLNDSSILEIQYCRSRYDYIDKLTDKRVSKIKTKKEAISASFEILSGIFNFPYDHKVTFNKNTLNKDIYLDNIEDLTFDEAFYKLYSLSFIRYLENLHLTNLNKIDNKIYTIVKLAILNNNKDVINKIISACYLEHSENILNSNINLKKITKNDIDNLVSENKKRIDLLKNEVLSYSLLDDLSRTQLENTFKCFSNNVFTTLSIKEKIYLTNLIYNYFSINGKKDLYTDYKKNISDKTNNKDCMELIIKNLMIKGNTMIIRRKNMDMINDILSWLPVIYNNEINKNEINKLNDLSSLIDELKR